MSDVPTIQSSAAGRTIRVADGRELARTVRACGESGEAICDYGAGCGGLGHAPPSGYVRIEQPSGVIEHDRSDFALRVHAATPLATLRSELESTGQFLPLDGLSPTQTIGEAVAHNLYGPLRCGYGSLRDLLLGVSFVDGTGRRVEAGGRTVKNVAGLDLVRLMVGSMNMLGLLDELTLRTHARPRRITQIALPGFDPALLDAHANALLRGNGTPWYLDWHRPISGRAALHIAYAGSASARNAGCAGLLDWLRSIGRPVGGLDSRDTTPAEDQAARDGRCAWRTEAGAQVKLIVPPAQTGALLARLCELAGDECEINALPLHGIIHFGGELSVDRARRIHEAIAASGALWQWFARPRNTPTLPPIGPPRNDWAVLAKLKQALDPRNVLNPGRMRWDV